MDDSGSLFGSVLVCETSLRLEVETNRGLELDLTFPMTVTRVGSSHNKVTHVVFEEWFVVGEPTKEVRP